MPLYETKTVITYEEYRKFAAFVRRNFTRVLIAYELFCAFFAVWANMAQDWVTFWIMSGCALIAGFVGVLVPELQARKFYKTTKIIHDIECEFRFYAGRMECVFTTGEASIRYSNFYKIGETKTNFYIMETKKRGHIIVKSNCSEELIGFLQSIK